MSTLEAAISFAALAHEGQFDKLGVTFILHPLRVMQAVSPEARIAAVLHDVIEGTQWTANSLTSEGFSRRDIEAVVALTHPKTEPYDAYIERCLQDAIAHAVKVADLRDNLMPERFDRLPEAFRLRRGPLYRAALQRLEGGR